MNNWEKPSKFFLNLEKRNFLNKNIPSFKDANDNTISDSKKNLNMQKEFYQSLITSTSITQVEHTKYYKYLHNITKITNHTKNIKHSDIEIEELEIAIKKQKKATSPDDKEFFKFFLEDLKHWIPRYFKEANDFFPEIALEGIITCIPKQGKLRNDLKNWRPLTLLNLIYKFYSSIIANRLKTTLPSLINEDQTGFISGRFIGENTRMIYDTIDYCETFQKEGILIILDFSKAFDTIEWPFIEYTLNLFNFGDKFINFIKFFFVFFGSLKKGNRPFLFIFLLAEHHGYARSIYQQTYKVSVLLVCTLTYISFLVQKICKYIGSNIQYLFQILSCYCSSI